MLRVADDDYRSFPRALSIDGDNIPVIVVGGFSSPKPFNATA